MTEQLANFIDGGWRRSAATEYLDVLDPATDRRSVGNMACLFTSSGAAARQFRCQVEAGNIGINVGVAVPMAFFPFSGWKKSFFGTRCSSIPTRKW